MLFKQQLKLLLGPLLRATDSTVGGSKKIQIIHQPKKVKRYGTVIGVKPEKLDCYKQLHANSWETVGKALNEANIRNYSIHLTQFDDGNWYLFSYFEHTGCDFEADMKKLGEDADIKRWWKETDPCQIGLENREKGEHWKKMEEIYHLQ